MGERGGRRKRRPPRRRCGGRWVSESAAGGNEGTGKAEGAVGMESSVQVLLRRPTREPS